MASGNGCINAGSGSSPWSAGPNAAEAALRGPEIPSRASTITWGTGPGLLAPFIRAARTAESKGQLTMLWRHQLDELATDSGSVTGVRGTVLEADAAPRGVATNRLKAGSFEYFAPSVVIATGGLGGNLDKVRAVWPERLGTPPEDMVSGVPSHVDGRGLDIAARAGARLVNQDRMWHYTEGITNWNPVWERHGIRILPGPSSLWIDATGTRLPDPLWPGFDTLGTLEHLRGTGYDYSWFILNRRIIGKEFALSGSEQNPDLTGRDVLAVLSRARGDVPGPVQAFLDHGEDFLQAPTIEELVVKMNQLTGQELLDPVRVAGILEARDSKTRNGASADGQISAIESARHYLGDKLVRSVKPHRITDRKAGPLIAVRLKILTRKSLGGIQTDLDSRVLDSAGNPVNGLYAAGEAAGFGGGGYHGYRALEGTFLGGCLFSGRAAGRHASLAWKQT